MVVIPSALAVGNVSDTLSADSFEPTGSGGNHSSTALISSPMSSAGGQMHQRRSTQHRSHPTKKYL